MSLIDLDAESRVNKNLGRMHRGIVVDDADPMEKGRVKIMIEGLIESPCPPDILPWAYPGISTQYRADLGGFTPPPVGTMLYVQFAHNNVYAPIYLGAAGDTTISSAGAYGSNIRPYEGAVYKGGAVAWDAADPHQKAFLNTLAGPESAGAYNVMYGGSTFSDYSKHPGIAHVIQSGPNAGKTSTAAGKYQFLEDTWNDVASRHGITDFSPESQDKAAWYLAEETYAQKTGGGSLSETLKSGDSAAIANVGKVLSGTWTSLPSGIEQGTTTDKFVNTFTKYLGSSTSSAAPSEEKENYDANQANSRQGPTVPKKEHLELATYGTNQIPVRQEGSKPETTVGTAFGVVDDGGTKAGLANYMTFDRANNTLDVALASLGINIHADNQGRTWINMDKDVTLTVGGSLHKYVKGSEVAQTDGETFTRRNGATTEYYDKNVAKTVNGDKIEKVSGSRMTVAGIFEVQADAHRSGAKTGAAVLGAETRADANGPATPDIDSEKGEEYREKKQKEFDEDKQVEHNKRQVYTDEITRGHSLVAEAAGSSAITQSNVMLGRIKDLILSGVNNRIPGGIMANLPGQGGGGLGGIFDMLGGDIMSKIMGFLPKEAMTGLGVLSNLAGGASIQSVLQPIIGQALGSALSQVSQYLPDNLKNLPLGLLNSGEISQVLASLTNKDALSSILTSTIKSQLSSLIPADLLKDDTVSKIVSTVMEVNKLGSLPDGQSPASSLAQIPAAKVATDVLSYINNYTGLDTGYFYQIASGLTTSNGSMKFPYQRDGVRAVLAKVVALAPTAKSVADILTETYPTLTRAQITAEAPKVEQVIVDRNTAMHAVIPTPTLMAVVTLAADEGGGEGEGDIPDATSDWAILAAYANPIHLLTANPPKEEEVWTAATQLVESGTDSQPPKAETGEDGKVPDPFKDMVIQAAMVAPNNPSGAPAEPTKPETTNPNAGADSLDETDTSQPAPASSTNPELISSCQARPQGAVGTPADPYAYQNGGTGEGGSAGGDYSVPGAGKMTDADWANMKYVTKANFENPGMMDRATVDAMDRASACNGSRIQWTEDGAASGHVSNSQHKHGNAFDVNLAGLDTAGKQKVLDCTLSAGFSGFGFYTNSPNMLHVDTRDSGNTWYWGNKNGNTPDWAAPVWSKHGGTSAILGRKPFGGKGRGYVGSGEGGVAGSGDADLSAKGETGATTGIGSRPIEYHQQGQQARSSERSYVIEIVARTCWGEAHGEGAVGIQAVAAVIRNRAMSGEFGSQNMAQLCLNPSQFECWKRASRLCNLTLGNGHNFKLCVDYAAQAVDGTIRDPTGGAKWFQSGKKAKHSWTDAHTPVAVIGGHRFYA